VLERRVCRQVDRRDVQRLREAFNPRIGGAELNPAFVEPTHLNGAIADRTPKGATSSSPSPGLSDNPLARIWRRTLKVDLRHAESSIMVRDSMWADKGPLKKRNVKLGSVERET
jgi:hypothetical protein